MRFSELVAALPPSVAPVVVHAEADPVIRGITYDSRAVSPGDLFAALRGELADGHDYVPQALELGAAAVLVESPPADLPAECAALVVADSRRVLAPVSAVFFGSPAEELQLIGVTGTNGKTSTTYLIESILARAGRRVGLIGTIEIRYADRRLRTPNTTPESLDLQRTLRAMRSGGIETTVMEVSSHGVALGRIDGCRFAVGAFTNVTQDHLDFHGTMESYREAKLDFFRCHLGPGATAVINADDAAADAFAEAARARGARVLRVARAPRPDVDVALEKADVSLDGTRARLRLPDGSVDVELPLVGDFNLENLLVAAGAAVAAGAPPAALAAGVAACPQVPGRVERVDTGIPGAPKVFVDYAHTPDAVDKLLRAVRPLARGRLLTLFGCGGDRDRGKRPLMAEAVARFSDRVVATSDNPRTEDPQQILADTEPGLSGLRRVEPERLAAEQRAYAVVVDRRQAIELAVRAAAPEDVVVLAGKGHEDYQLIGRERLPFDDRDEARAALRGRGLQ